MKKRQLFLSAITAAIFIISLFSFVYLPETEHVNASAEETERNDFSAQAQVYLEYFGKHLKNRSGLLSQHHKTERFIVSELKRAGYKDEQTAVLPIEGR